MRRRKLTPDDAPAWIAPQEAEIITLRDGRITDVSRLIPAPRQEGGLRRLVARIWGELRGQLQRDRFVIGEGAETAVPVEAGLLAGRERFCLLDGESDRPRLHLLPGMRGEIRVGACALTADQMLRDPSLRRDGASSYPLPHGAEARIRCGALTFLIRCVAPGTPAFASA